MRLVARVFLLDGETNLPTLFSFSLLGLCSALLTTIALRRMASGGTHVSHWFFLAAVFFLMAFDEAASVHEKTSALLGEMLGAGGFLYYAWVIPGLVFVGTIALIYFRFLLALPRPFMRLFLLSGALYVGGAIGIEMPEGAYAEVHGTQNFGFHLFATVEEALEMIGLALFAYTLLRVLGHEQGQARLPFRIV